MVLSGALNLDDLLHSEYHSYKKWKVPLESVEKVVSKSECRKLFQLGLNHHNVCQNSSTDLYECFGKLQMEIDTYVFFAEVPNWLAKLLSYLRARFNVKPFVGKDDLWLLFISLVWYTRDPLLK